MNSQAKVLLLQFCPKIGDKMYNCNKIGQMICDNFKDGLDLVIMPEFFPLFLHLYYPENERSLKRDY